MGHSRHNHQVVKTDKTLNAPQAPGGRLRRPWLTRIRATALGLASELCSSDWGLFLNLLFSALAFAVSMMFPLPPIRRNRRFRVAFEGQKGFPFASDAFSTPHAASPLRGWAFFAVFPRRFAFAQRLREGCLFRTRPCLVLCPHAATLLRGGGLSPVHGGSQADRTISTG